VVKSYPQFSQKSASAGLSVEQFAQVSVPAGAGTPRESGDVDGPGAPPASRGAGAEDGRGGGSGDDPPLADWMGRPQTSQ
jgi:hypothetical protein